MSVATQIRCLAAAGSMLALLVTTATADVTNDRWYRLGEDAGEGAVVGGIVGANSTPVAGLTRDSQGPSGAFLHMTVNGAPTYVSTVDRPGAGAGAIGASLVRTSDASGDYFRNPISLNAPTNMWDSDTFFPPDGPQFSLNYEGIYAHGIQAWVKPNGATQNVRQDIVIDTMEHGIYITPTNTWGLVFNDFSLASPTPVAYNNWTHVMQLAGFADPDDGRLNIGGALLVNGVAVVTSGASGGDVFAHTYTPTTETALVVGANVDANANFYHGVLDELQLFLWGKNTRETNGGAGPNGQDWGDLNLAEDNEWIARELSTRGVTDPADVNLDGVVNNADITAFIPDFGKVRSVNGVQIGDWLSRQDGDLNYDGITDLSDAFILHDGLISAGFAAGLDFSLLSGGSVPEPTAALLLIMGMMGLGAARPRRRQL